MCVSGVYGSVGQPKASKPEVPGSTPGSSCFSPVFIKNLINDKSKHKNNMLLFVLYSPGPLAVIYNMYKSLTSWGSICIRYLYYIQYIYEISINKYYYYKKRVCMCLCVLYCQHTCMHTFRLKHTHMRVCIYTYV